MKEVLTEPLPQKRNKEKPVGANFPALQLLNDPQTFAEKLYERLQKHDRLYSLDHKILYLQLLSRVMGSHKLCVLGFYTYIVRCALLSPCVA